MFCQCLVNRLTACHQDLIINHVGFSVTVFRLVINRRNTERSILLNLQAAADFDISSVPFHLDSPSAFRLVISMPVLNVTHDNYIFHDVAQAVHDRVIVLAGRTVGINGFFIIGIQNRPRGHIILVFVSSHVLPVSIPKELIKRRCPFAIGAGIHILQKSFIRGKYQAVTRIH